jgi:hypothetical protein
MTPPHPTLLLTVLTEGSKPKPSSVVRSSLQRLWHPYPTGAFQAMTRGSDNADPVGACPLVGVVAGLPWGAVASPFPTAPHFQEMNYVRTT